MIFFSHKCGQLGNRLFAFGHLVAFAIESNSKIVNLSFDEYGQYFQTTRHDALCRYPASRSWFTSARLRSVLFFLNRLLLKLLRLASIHKSCLHQILIADLPEYQFTEARFYELNSSTFNKTVNTKAIVLLFGRFFRDFKNFEKHQDEIRLYFKPQLEIQQNVNSLIQKLRSAKNTCLLVGVHIRRGDYKEFAGGKYFYDLMDYRRIMLDLKNRHTDRPMHFLICSNEIIHPSNFGDIDCTLGIGTMVEDLYSLASCDLLMGPPSTFTKWASFFGKVPLFQIENLEQPITIEQFVILPPERLYNF